MINHRSDITYLDDGSHEHDRRITVLEKDVEVLQRDVREHKIAMDQVVSVLNSIRDEVISAKGFLKAFCIGSVVVCTLIGAAYTVQWIQVPAVNKHGISN